LDKKKLAVPLSCKTTCTRITNGFEVQSWQHPTRLNSTMSPWAQGAHCISYTLHVLQQSMLLHFHARTDTVAPMAASHCSL